MGDDQRPGADQAPTDQTTGRTLTVSEAAEALGISAAAVRRRIKRGTLETMREGRRVFVVLGAAAERPSERARPTEHSGELVDVLKEQNAFLREQLRREQDAHAEARRIIAGLVPQRASEIGAPQEARESPETVDQEQEGAVGVVVEGARARSKAKGPPVLGGPSVIADSTLLTSIVPLPVEYERDPYIPRYVRDRRVPDDAVIVYETTSRKLYERMRYSDWPVWLRRWRAKVYARSTTFLRSSLSSFLSSSLKVLLVR